MSVASTQPVPSPAPRQAGAADERMARVGVLVRLLQRRELGALLGAVAIYVLFASVDATPGHKFSSIAGMQNWTDAASSYGIMAVAVAMLMIGGEFDLSAGVMTGTSGLLLGRLITRYGLNVWAGILIVLVFAALVGAMNGYIVVRTKLPSFIVTLATFFVLRGMNVGVTLILTNTVRFDVSDQAPGFSSAHAIRGGTFLPPYTCQAAVLWWFASAPRPPVDLPKSPLRHRF